MERLVTLESAIIYGTLQIVLTNISKNAQYPQGLKYNAETANKIAASHKNAQYMMEESNAMQVRAVGLNNFTLRSSYAREERITWDRHVFVVGDIL